MYLNRIIVSFAFIGILSESLPAQLTVDNSVDAAAGVQSFLLGDGVTISNLTFFGENTQFASFSCNGCGLDIASGFVMSTGNASGAIGPNNQEDYQSPPDDSDSAGDVDLEELSGQETHNAAIVEFDFEAVGTTVAFNFVFGSEEYLEYVNSINDVFGFFLSGPGIVGAYSGNAINIALVPNTNTPISINNINNTQNAQYFRNNSSDAYNIQADGFTTVLTAGYTGLTCGQTYHIKLALADASDGWLDSWVFFEAGSFVSEATSTSLTPALISPSSGAIYEGCPGAELQISRASSAVAETFDLTYGGSASIQLDFELLTTVIQFAPGESTATLPITALQDNLPEGVEIVEITVSGNSCGGVFNDIYILEIHDTPTVSVPNADVVLNCGESSTTIELIPTGGIAPLTIVWENGATGSTLTWPVTGPDNVQYTITDACSNAVFVSAVSIDFSAPPALIVDAGSDQSGNCLEVAAIAPQINGGFGNYSYEWTFQNVTISTDAQVNLPFNSPGTYTVQVTDQCGNQATDHVTLIQELYSIQADLGPDLSVSCLDVLTLDIEIIGAIGDVAYTWSDNNGFLSNSAQLTYSTFTSSTVTATVVDACGVIDSDAITLQVPQTIIAIELPSITNVPCDGFTPLTAQVSGGVGTYTYTWELEGNLISTGVSCEVPSLHGSDVTLTVADACNNIGQAVTEVSVPPILMQADAGPSQTTDCLNPVIIAPQVTGGNGLYTYEWRINGQVISANPVLEWFYSEDTEVILHVEDGCGNMAGDVATVFVPDVPVVVNAGNDLIATCIELNQVEATAQGGVGVLSYEWSSGGVLLASEALLGIIATGDTLLTVSVEDECGHSALDELMIRVPPVPIVIGLPSDTLLCAGTEVQVPARAEGGIGELSHRWDIAPSGSDTLLWLLDSPVAATLTTTDVCGNTVQHTITLQTEFVEASFGFEYTGNMSASFTNTSTGATAYAWSFGDGASSEEVHPEHSFGTVDNWLVQLFAFSPLGCISTAEALLLPAGEVFIPTAFTPDFDGLNDVFKAEGHSLKRFELTIFNRWGEVVFRSSNLSDAWDGAHVGGEYSVPDNQYIYRYEAEDFRGRVWENSGSITLLR